MRRLGLWTLTIAVVVLGNAPSAWAGSLPGTLLDEAQKEDFFQFFHLKKRAIDERDDLATHYFRPPLRDDVVVCVDTDKAGKILQMSLIVGREFIDEPTTNIFARDLVKSFIEAATPLAGAADTSSVVNEIFLRGTQLATTDAKTIETPGGKKEELGNNKGLIKVGTGELKKGDTAILLNGKKLPKIPEKISDSFRAFEGTIENADTPITGARLVLKNHEVAKGRFLEVRVDLDTVKKLPKLEVVVDQSPSSDSESTNEPSDKRPPYENSVYEPEK